MTQVKKKKKREMVQTAQTKFNIETSFDGGIQMRTKELDELKPKNTGFIERRFFTLALKPRASYGLSYLMQLAMCQGLSQKVRFIWRTLLPPGEILHQRYVFPQGKRGPLSSHLLRRFAGGTKVLSYLGRNLL